MSVFGLALVAFVGVTLVLTGLPAFAVLIFAAVLGAGTAVLGGTIPLALFDVRSYGALVGMLVGPALFLSAAAPLAYAAIIEHFGTTAALWVSLVLSLVTMLGAFLLRQRFRPT